MKADPASGAMKNVAISSSSIFFYRLFGDGDRGRESKKGEKLRANRGEKAKNLMMKKGRRGGAW